MPAATTGPHSNEAVHRVMRSPVFALAPTDTLRNAALLLRRHDVGAAPVVARNRLVGLLSERDVVQAVADGDDLDLAPVGGAMTHAPRPIHPDDPLWAAAMLMLRYGVRHLPVVDGARLVGIVSIRDALAVVERDRLVEPGTTIAALSG